MSKMQDINRPSRPASRSRGAPPPPERRLVLSGLVHRTLVSFNERSQQRRVLLNLLILAQALLVLAAAPAYLSGPSSPVAIAALLFALLSCLLAAGLNQFFRNPVRAAYVLVIGGAVGVLVLVIVSAVAGNPLEAAHTSLLLVPVMLETGLLFAPEVTLLTAGVSIVVTIAALLFALSVNSAGTRQETYGLVVDILGVQIVSAMIAWLLSQFIYESALEAQRAQEQQFAQARLEAMSAQSADLHQRLDAAIADIQRTLGRAINGDYAARIALPEGPLAVLVASLNMLLERLSALSQGDVVRQRMEAAALPLIDVVGRMPEGGTPPPASLPVMTNTPMDNVSLAVAQMQASVNRRLVRVQELAGEVVGALAHTHNGVSATSQTASEALRTVGAAIAASDGMLSAAQRDVDLAARALRVLATLRPTDAGAHAEIPDEVTDSAGIEGVGTSLLGLGADLGVGAPGLTGAFEAMSQAEAEALQTTVEVAPTTSADAVATGAGGANTMAESDTNTHATTTKRTRAAKAAPKLEEPSPAVLELARLLEQLRDEVNLQERSATTLVHELGIVNRHVRGVDVGVAWARHALEAVRRNAEKLLQTSGGATALPTTLESAPISIPLGETGPRGSGPSRPLAEPAWGGATFNATFSATTGAPPASADARPGPEWFAATAVAADDQPPAEDRMPAAAPEENASASATMDRDEDAVAAPAHRAGPDGTAGTE